MSATFETDIFALYFAVRISGRMELAPVVAVEGRSFPVTEFYLDDVRDVAEVHELGTLSIMSALSPFFIPTSFPPYLSLSLPPSHKIQGYNEGVSTPKA